MDKYFEIGQIVNTNGLKGVVKVKPFTDDITEFETFESIYVQKKADLVEFKIESVNSAMYPKKNRLTNVAKPI